MSFITYIPSLIIGVAFLVPMIAIIYMLSRPSIRERQSRIMNLYSSVLSDMNQDFRDNDMRARDIHMISKSIAHLTDEIEKYGKIIHTAPIDDKKWLAQMIDEYRIQLRLWIDRHASELDILEKEISSLQSNSQSEKSVLELSQQRLENQKILLEKI